MDTDRTVLDVTGAIVTDAILEATMVTMLDARRPGATMCPSEVARACTPLEADWRALMPRVRAVAAVLASAGRLVATRRGEVVDATSPGGPIRLARVAPNAHEAPGGDAPEAAVPRSGDEAPD